MESNTQEKSLQGFYDECDPGKYFKCIDGSTLKSIGEFVEAMEWMSDDVFYYHVNDDNNDFANWIQSVFNDKEIADLIRHSRTKERTQISLLYYMLKKVLKK